MSKIGLGRIGKCVTRAERERFITQTLEPHVNAFALHDDEMGEARNVEFEIDTGATEPISFPPRRLSPEKRDAIDKEVDNLLRTGRIVPGNGEWASPIIPVKNPNGQIRLCVDYRQLNKATKRDVYPLPRGDDLIEGIGQLKVKYLTTMDIKAGYHNFRVGAESKEKTAFIYPGGLYQYRFMPFGVMNAPVVFQRYMDQLFHDFDQKQVVVYIDDVLVKSESYEEHLEIVEKVIARLHDAGLLISVEKSRFLRDKVTYLGHEISAEGVRPGLKKESDRGISGSEE